MCNVFTTLISKLNSLECPKICISLYFFVVVEGTPAINPVEIPKEPEFVIFASYSHPPNMPMRHSVLKEMVSGE